MSKVKFRNITENTIVVIGHGEVGPGEDIAVDESTDFNNQNFEKVEAKVKKSQKDAEE